METETELLSELKPPSRNVRAHPEAQISELIKSVQMFGVTRPLVVDECNTILAGNGLAEACRKLAMQSVPVLRVSGLTESEKTKLMLADNKIFQLGLDDHNAIMDMIRELDDLNIPGFDEEILRSLTAPTQQATQDALNGYGTLNDEAVAGALGRDIPAGSTEPSPDTDGATFGNEVICPHCGHVFER